MADLIEYKFSRTQLQLLADALDMYLAMHDDMPDHEDCIFEAIRLKSHIDDINATLVREEGEL